MCSRSDGWMAVVPRVWWGCRPRSPPGCVVLVSGEGGPIPISLYLLRAAPWWRGRGIPRYVAASQHSSGFLWALSDPLVWRWEGGIGGIDCDINIIGTIPVFVFLREVREGSPQILGSSPIFLGETLGCCCNWLWFRPSRRAPSCLCLSPCSWCSWFSFCLTRSFLCFPTCRQHILIPVLISLWRMSLGSPPLVSLLWEQPHRWEM